MKDSWIIDQLDALTDYQAQIREHARDIHDRMGVVVAWLDMLEEAGEYVIEGEVLAVETTGEETEFLVADPPIKEGSVTVYLNGNPVSADTYTVENHTAIVPVDAVPAGARLTIDYTHRDRELYVIDMFPSFPSLSVASLREDRADYQQAMQWIEDNLLE